MKRVLCISPHFPPTNAADMHRLRQSLPYFVRCGWYPICFVVDPNDVEISQEPLLVESLPDDIEIHRVRAYSTKWTRKIGLGNLGFRSWFQFRFAVDQYLKNHKVDLIYFSTTVFSIMSLGIHWKKKFGVPFIIDLQDPWRNDYYLALKKSERPKKFWFDYQQKKYLEKITMPLASGIVSVSDGYINTMRSRYSQLSKKPCLTLPFGALEHDMKIASQVKPIPFDENYLNIVYIGRGGNDMKLSLSALFAAFTIGLEEQAELFSRVKFSFIGTSYASDGNGLETIFPIAREYGVEQYVIELTNRLPYYQAMSTLQNADVLFVPGSTDSQYTASKIFPYIMTKKPLLAIFHKNSSIVKILRSSCAGKVVTFATNSQVGQLSKSVYSALSHILNKIPYVSDIDEKVFGAYSALEMTKKQCRYFDEVIDIFE